MTPPPRANRSHLVLVAVLIAVSGSGCTKHDALVLLDLRSSGPLGASVALVRLSAPGWKTRVTTATIGPEGLRVGYYGPADGSAVSVTAEALDGVGCVLGEGSATVPELGSGATSDPITLFVRPLPDSGCTLDPVDAGSGVDAGVVEDAGSAEDAGAVEDASGVEDASAVEDAGEDTGSADASGADDTGTDTGPSDTGISGDGP